MSQALSSSYSDTEWLLLEMAESRCTAAGRTANMAGLEAEEHLLGWASMEKPFSTSWSPVRTLPVAPLWCDLGFVPNGRGNKAAANLCPHEQKGEF